MKLFTVLDKKSNSTLFTAQALSSAQFCSNVLPSIIRTRSLKEVEIHELGEITVKNSESVEIKNTDLIHSWSCHLNPDFLIDNMKLAGMTEKEIDEQFAKMNLKNIKEIDEKNKEINS